MGDRHRRRDVAVGVVLDLALAFGLSVSPLLYGIRCSSSRPAARRCASPVEGSTIAALIGLGVITLTALAAIMRPLIFASLQPELAEAKGVPLRFISTAFLAIVALAVSESAQVVGVLLVFSLMVGPPSTAQRLVAETLDRLALSAGLALVEAWLGIAIAYRTDWPVSFCIAVLSALGYFATRGRWSIGGGPTTAAPVADKKS